MRRSRGRGGALVLGGLLLLGGCATGPAGGERAPAAGAAGTAAAATGWISGDAAKQQLRRTATGAGVGSLTGGAAGYYMDVAESKLKEQVDGSGVGVARRGDDLTLSMPASLAFASDSAELNTAFGAVLDRVAQVLARYEKTVIEVAGHTDSVGSREHNQALSERRAAAVAASLERHGVAKSRIIVVGSGETRPIASNDTAEGRARNRRVELTVVPIAPSGG